MKRHITQVKSNHVQPKITLFFKRVNMKSTFLCYIQRTTTSYFTLSLVQFGFCVLKIWTFFGVFCKVMRHLYMFFQFFLHILLNVSCVNIFWIVVVIVCVCFVSGLAPEWKLFRTQKCEKINIAEVRISHTILCLHKRIHNKAVNQEKVNTSLPSSHEMHKNSNIETDEHST